MITLQNTLTEEVMLVKNVDFIDMKNIIVLDVAPPDHHDCMFIAGKWQRSKEQALQAIRIIRNNLMKGCDWTQIGDQKQETKDLWKDYRDKLRNLPETCEDPFNPIWPEVPK